MITLGGTESARIAAHAKGVALLLDMNFLSGMQRLTNAPINVPVGANTYTALSGMLNVSQMKESESSNAERITISLTVANAAWFAFAMGNVNEYRGRRITIYLQLFDEAFMPAGAPVKRWAGYMDKISISRKSGGLAGKNGGAIELTCYRAGMARVRSASAERLSHAQQLKRSPGDNGLEYVQTLIDKPVTWLTKRFQEQ